MKDIKTIIFIIYSVLFVALLMTPLFFTVKISLPQKVPTALPIRSETYFIDYPNCSDMNLFNTTRCLVHYTSTFYKYNITDDSINLSLSEIKIRGGDCKNWAEYYVSELAYFNYTGIPVTFRVSGNIMHEVVIVSSLDGYCIIDQELYSCFGLNLNISRKT